MQPKKSRDKHGWHPVFQFPDHIWACRVRDQRNGWAEDSIFYFKMQKFFEVLLVICFFQSTFLIFLGYEDIEETNIICTGLSNLSGTIVLCGKVSQPSPPPDPRGARRRGTTSLLLVLPFASSVAIYLEICTWILIKRCIFLYLRYIVILSPEKPIWYFERGI